MIRRWCGPPSFVAVRLASEVNRGRLRRCGARAPDHFSRRAASALPCQHGSAEDPALPRPSRPMTSPLLVDVQDLFRGGGSYGSSSEGDWASTRAPARLPAPNSSTSLCCRTSKRGRPERRVLEPPTEPHVRRVSDGCEEDRTLRAVLGRDAAGGCTSSEGVRGRAKVARAGSGGVRLLIEEMGSRAGSGQGARERGAVGYLGGAGCRLLWVRPALLWRPRHRSRRRWTTSLPDMARAGVGGHPFIISTGEERTRTIPDAKARSISVDVRSGMGSNMLPPVPGTQHG